MKLFELVRGDELVATVNCHQIEPGRSPFLCLLRNEKHELLATIYLGHGIVVREAATDKCSVAETLPSAS